MDLPAAPPRAENPDIPKVACGMCKQRVPSDQTRTISGRVLCLGCLSAWYSEDDEE
jgi:hypothetical protein